MDGRTDKEFIQDCSQIIDVMQTAGGIDEYIKSFNIEYHYKKPSTTEMEKYKKDGKRHVFFHPSSSRSNAISGHFHFIDPISREYTSSYEKRWQNSGSNGFCQTFAVMGAIGLGTQLTGLSKQDCSLRACRFLIENIDKWIVYWKQICIDHQYFNIKMLDKKEIVSDILLCTTKGMLWKLIQDEIIYI